MTELQSITGGIQTVEPRCLDHDNPFEMDCKKLLSDRMKDDGFCEAFWGSLANVIWENKEKGQKVIYSFRAAGDLICSIRGEGSYLTWYCSSPTGVVDSEVSDVLTAHGWTHRNIAKEDI